VQVTAILNPNDGIFSSADEQFARVVSDFTGEGGQVVGYVATGYGTGRSVSAVKQNIDNYLRYYGRNQLSGFFITDCPPPASTWPSTKRFTATSKAWTKNCG